MSIDIRDCFTCAGFFLPLSSIPCLSFVLFFLLFGNSKKLEIIESPTVPLPTPQKLHFNITADIKKAIEEAKQSIDKWVQKLLLKF